MTQEDKELLLKDLCARLPYGVIVRCTWELFQEGSEEGIGVLEDVDITKKQIRFRRNDISTNIPFNRIDGTVLPYLRPMSSMTEEERGELKEYLDAEEVDYDGFGYSEGGTLEDYISFIPYSVCIGVVDRLNAHHFDYRGLIEKKLALEAPEDMYSI